MRAILTKTEVMNGKNWDGDKERVNSWKVIAHVNGEFREVVEARCWMGRSRNSSVVYAAIWIHDKGVHCAGHGQAGGWGYHKESAASIRGGLRDGWRVVAISAECNTDSHTACDHCGRVIVEGADDE